MQVMRIAVKNEDHHTYHNDDKNENDDNDSK